MSFTPKIEHDVPIPPKATGRPQSPARLLAKSMKVGASVFFEDHSAYNTARRAISELGGKCCTRKREENGVKGWRLWRTK